MKLKFLKDAWVNGEVIYQAGKIYEVSDDTGSASRWMRRGIAEVAKDHVEVKVVEEDTTVKDAQETLAQEEPSQVKVQNKSKKFPRR